MILCKKKMAILSTVCALMVCMIFVLCSFTPPTVSTTRYNPGRMPTLSEAELLVSIVDLQYNCGSFNSLVPVVLYYSPVGNCYYLYLIRKNSNFTLSFTNDGSGWSLWYGNIMFLLEFTLTGFSMLSTATTFNGETQNLIAYRLDRLSPFIVNPSNVWSSGNNSDDVFIDAHSIWYDYYSFISSDLGNSGYDEGFADGYDSGILDGYSTGYFDGYETGYRNGYYQGDIDGYESGFEDGYESGYDDGYATAERETEIVYVEPVELNIPAIFDGMASGVNGIFKFVNWDIFGINILGVLLSITIAAILVFVFKRLRV